MGRINQSYPDMASGINLSQQNPMAQRFPVNDCNVLESAGIMRMTKNVHATVGDRAAHLKLCTQVAR